MLGIQLDSNFVFTRDDRSVVKHGDFGEVSAGGEPISRVYETHYHTFLVTDSGRVFKACMNEDLTLEEKTRQTEFLGMYVNIWHVECASAYVVVENNGRNFTYYSFSGGASMFRCAVTNAFPSEKCSYSAAYVGDLLFIDDEAWELPGLGKVDPSEALEFIRKALNVPLDSGDFVLGIDRELDTSKLIRREDLERQLVVVLQEE